MKFRFVPIALLVVCALACSCSKKKHPPVVPPADTVEFADLDPSLATAVCELASRCPRVGSADARALRVNAGLPGPATCEQLVTLSHLIDHDAIAPLVAAGSITYDAAAAKRCLDAVNASCSEVLETLRTQVDCLAMLSGTLANAAPCTTDLECAGDASCKPTNVGSCAGVCTPVAQFGEPCSGGAPECDPEVEGGWLECRATTDNTTPHCVRTTVTNVAAGQPCGAVATQGDELRTARCEAGTYCKLTAGEIGTCVASLPLGSPCDSLTDACAGTLQCMPDDSFTFTCMTPVIRTNVGDACASFSEICSPFGRLTCGPDSTCVRIGTGAVGEVCRAEYPTDCDDGLYCDDSVHGMPSHCAQTRADGAACATDAAKACTSGFCDSQTTPGSPVCAPFPTCL